MSFGDIGRRPDQITPNVSEKSAITPQQLSQTIGSLQKKCAALKEKIVALRRKKASQQEKLDVEKEISTLRQEAGMCGAQIEAQRLKVDKTASSGGDASVQRAALNKLVKDFELVKGSIDVVGKEAGLIRVSTAEELAKDSFNRTSGPAAAASAASSSTATYTATSSASRTTEHGTVMMHQQQQITMNVVEVEDLLIMEREKDIKKLNHDLYLVNDMYKDMAKLVEQQGAQIDNIHEAADTSHEQAKAGLEQVKQAATYQPGCVIC